MDRSFTDLTMATRVREWEAKFLDALRVHANVSAAAKAAGITRIAAYLRRKKNATFSAKWDTAIEEAIDGIELAVTNASLQGDMATARWFLSRRRPHIYGDRMALEHQGKDGGPVVVTVDLGENKRNLNRS